MGQDDSSTLSFCKEDECPQRCDEVSGGVNELHSAEKKPSVDEKKSKKHKKRNLWAVKITVISFVLSCFVSFLSEMTVAGPLVVTLMLLLFLILASILFDGIGVAATSCDLTPFTAMASKKVYGAKTAIWLVKNNEKVSNVCNDVIGDTFGIISGSCATAVVIRLALMLPDGWQKWLAMAMSGVVSALTIGGKAFLKTFAISNSKDFIMFVARIIAVFNKDERKNKKKDKSKGKKVKDKSDKRTSED